MEFESVDEGVIAKILVTEGPSGVPVNQPIALILEEGEGESALDNYVSDCATNIEAKKEVETNPSVPSNSSISSNPPMSSNLPMSSQCLTLGSRKEEGTEGRT